MSEPAPAVHDRAARLPLRRLTALWFQVTGLLCNLECTHCLVDSSPTNRNMAFLDRERIRRELATAERLGVREVYFTGGEPFLHREMPGILEDALAVAPATVLTNGTLITERMAGHLAELVRHARYSLELRISMDHPDPARNDAVRGAGTHAKALRAARRLQDAGLLPIITATEFLFGPREPGSPGVYEAFLDVLRDAGITRPRLKVIPVFRTGKLEEDDGGGPVTEAMLAGMEPGLLQCGESRLVAADGVYACPILVGRSVARVGTGGLETGLGDAHLAHHACRTCYETGMTCGNF